MAKNYDEAYDLLEIMAANNYQWPLAQMNQPRAHRIQETDAVSTLTAQVASLIKMMETFIKNMQLVQNLAVVCELCVGNHPINKCPINLESVQYIGNYNQQQPNNPSYYHPRVKNLPNQSWSNNQAQSYAPRQAYQSSFQNQPPPLEKESHLEEMLAKFINTTDVRMTSLESSMRSIENQVGQIASAV